MREMIVMSSISRVRRPPGTNGVARAIDILNLFGEPGVVDLGVTEIAERLEISKAVIHRVLTAFRTQEYLELDEKTRRYRLGVGAIRLGLTYLDRVDGEAIARSSLRDLVAATQETATLSICSGWSRVYLAQETPSRTIKMVVQLGSTFPLHAGASSKALLAFLPRDVQETYLATARLETMTTRTITDVDALWEELAAIREAGFATSRGERQEGAGSVAAPVLDHSGQPIAAISVCGPVERFVQEIDTCREALLQVTSELSRRSGYAAKEAPRRKSVNCEASGDA